MGIARGGGHAVRNCIRRRVGALGRGREGDHLHRLTTARRWASANCKRPAAAPRCASDAAARAPGYDTCVCVHAEQNANRPWPPQPRQRRRNGGVPLRDAPPLLRLRQGVDPGRHPRDRVSTSPTSTGTGLEEGRTAGLHRRVRHEAPPSTRRARRPLRSPDAAGRRRDPPSDLGSGSPPLSGRPRSARGDGLGEGRARPGPGPEPARAKARHAAGAPRALVCLPPGGEHGRAAGPNPLSALSRGKRRGRAER